MVVARYSLGARYLLVLDRGFKYGSPLELPDGRAPFGAWRLRRAQIEFSGADDVDCS